MVAAAKSLALDLAEGRVPRRQSLQRTDKLGDVQESTAICDMARSQACTLTLTLALARVDPTEAPSLTLRRALWLTQAAKTQPNLVHPRLCVDAVMHGLTYGSAAGLAKEREVFNACVHSEVGSSLVHIFLSRVSDARCTPRSNTRRRLFVDPEWSVLARRHRCAHRRV